ncbi:sulfite exporter TauE/SafE family protein [Methylomonas paludis]|uniref:Probable membrane transporter protein n=1 Tax=Methylomonas paludis TaxID=1173101 RepID=A0A975MMR3_9GAMM|nr:sulfite exporter TauE/SafE family protein [Methylomonas paludis]QWF70675.1 sulfite exporter TauE/SafE family protein [Methylomonas paludis]
MSILGFELPLNFAHHPLSELLLIALAGLYAGTQNTLAGGGSFITFPTLLLAGLNPLAANITSTIALYPNQITSALAGRKLAGGVNKLSLGQLFSLSIAGGITGALLLLNTPVSIFAKLVPWLVLVATLIFCWGSFRRKSLHSSRVPTPVLALIQFVIGIYGGYFGGGIGILMLAALTIAGQQVRTATATKNVLAMAMNTSAVGLFAFSSQIDWLAAVALAIGGIAGGLTGSWLVHRLPEKIMRGFVVVVGFGLTGWLFWR